MEVTVLKHGEKDLKVTIFCCQIDEKVKKLKQHIKLFDENIKGKRNNETVFVKLSEVLYFEVVDNRTFLYTVDDVLEEEQKLYELESVLSTRNYILSVLEYIRYTAGKKEFFILRHFNGINRERVNRKLSLKIY